MDDKYAHWSQFRQPLTLWGGLNGYLFIGFLILLLSFSLVKLFLLIVVIIVSVIIERVFKYQYPYIPPALRMNILGKKKYTRRGRRRYSL